MANLEQLKCPTTGALCTFTDCKDDKARIKKIPFLQRLLPDAPHAAASDFCYLEKRRILATNILNAKKDSRERVAAVALLTELQENHEARLTDQISTTEE